MNIHIKRLCLSALCLAMAAILPWLFHTVPNAGRVISPLHIPVLLCGLSCGWYYGTVCGLIAPVLSSLITGMPPLAMVPSMTAECAIYGLVAGLLIYFIKTRHTALNLFISLVFAMLLGRVAYGLVNFFFFGGQTPPHIWLMGSFATGLPGIILHLILVPALYLVLYKTGLIPRKNKA